MAPKKHELEHDVKRDAEARVRGGVKAVLEGVLEEEMTGHPEAGYRGSTPTPGEGNATAATRVTRLRPRAGSSAWRWRATGRAGSSRGSLSGTSG